jgi:hypothetical protein
MAESLILSSTTTLPQSVPDVPQNEEIQQSLKPSAVRMRKKRDKDREEAIHIVRKRGHPLLIPDVIAVKLFNAIREDIDRGVMHPVSWFITEVLHSQLYTKDLFLICTFSQQ